MPILSSGTTYPLTIPAGNALVTIDLSGTSTVTGVTREDASRWHGAGAKACNPVSTATAITISTTGKVDYRLVAGDATPSSESFKYNPVTFDSTPSDVAAVAAALGGAVLGETTGTEAGIRAAAAAVSLMGGGIVQLQAKTYTITSALPLISGVVYRGAGYTLAGYGGLSGGTIVQGDGTFPIFSAAATDLGALPGSIAAARTELVTRCGVKDMALKDGTYGIKCGALYKAGVYWGDFDNLYISGMTQWGVWFENFIECRFSRFKTETTNGVGHMWFGDSTGTLWNHGNSTIQQWFCEVGGAYTRI